MCEIMNTLKAIEQRARADCHASGIYELQAVFGQHSLAAQQMQAFHAERCQECIDEAHSAATRNEVRP